MSNIGQETGQEEEDHSISKATKITLIIALLVIIGLAVAIVICSL